ncbi:aldehyde reductase [Colletotrichum kahawae]|uniref:Aldehyde reductase n=1 Tax=Colletotrichum kahawae TaxID=34407 RepID=A0AAE0D745_COLKA|nr:aldehyde reductase [Colletotrichum kahawae]
MSFGNKAKLNSVAEIPTLGYGTWQSKPGEVSVGVYEALKAGYRHLDLAKIYQNQPEVGEGLKKALADIPGLKREDIFITSKLWNNIATTAPRTLRLLSTRPSRSSALTTLTSTSSTGPLPSRRTAASSSPRPPATIPRSSSTRASPSSTPGRP